jgi:hypothetical protein
VSHEGENGSTADASTRLDYTGDQYVTVGSTPNLLGTLNQSQAPEAADSEYVDFSKSNVYAVFKIYPGDCGTSCATAIWTSANIAVANRSDWATTGTGFAQVSGPKTLGEGSYLVTASLVANGYIVAEGANATLTVASATGTFIAGGGFVATDSTSNAVNRKGHFSFNIKAGNGSLQGSSIYVYRMRMDTAASTMTKLVACATLAGNCHDVDVIVRSNKLTALNTGTASAYPMTGFATGQVAVQFVDAMTGVHYAQFEFGGGTFRLDLTDSAAGGTSDKYGFTAYRKDGSVFHQAYLPASGAISQTGTGAATNQVALGGGNTSVHK